MPDAILTDIPSDGEKFQLFSDEKQEKETTEEKKDEQQDNAAGSSAENNQTEHAPSQGGADEKTEEVKTSSTPEEENVPFNKHPRWKELQQDLAREREEKAQLLEKLGTLAPTLEALTKQREEVATEKIPEWFAALYGADNHDAWHSYQADLDAKIGRVKSDIRAEMEAERVQKQKEADHWNSWMQSSLDRVQTQYNVSLPDGSSDRNEFLKYVLKYKPTDDNGNIDFVLGYELYSQLKEAERSKDATKNQARKQIAAQTTSSGKEPKKDFVPTAKTLRNRSFLDLALESLNEN